MLDILSLGGYSGPGPGSEPLQNAEPGPGPKNRNLCQNSLLKNTFLINSRVMI